MTTYTFVPTSSTTQVNWDTPSIWSGGAVPNGSDADVVIPAATVVATGQPYVSFITLSGAETVHSLSIEANDLILQGALTIGDALSLSSGAEIDMMAAASSLTAASVVNDGYDIQGEGEISCSGLFANESRVIGTGLALNAGSLDNTGLLSAGPGGLTVTVSPGGFANLSGSTLTGGSYSAGADSSGGNATLALNVGGVVTVDAASIALGLGGDIVFWDNVQSAYVPIEATLQTVAASGILVLYQDLADSWGAVTVDGVLQLQGGRPAFTQLTVDPVGRVGGTGSISGPIVDNGTITAGQDGSGGALMLAGPVTGSGTLQIATAQIVTSGSRGAPQYVGASLELGGASSAAVVFRDSHGTLILDDPADFTGRIAVSGDGGDSVLLKGVSFSSVTGWSYSGDRTGGTLEIDLSGGSHLDLSFAGDFVGRSFTVAADPPALSTDPAGLQIGALGQATPAPDMLRDHFNGSGVSDILLSNPDGGVVVGELSGGQESYTRVAGLGPEWSFQGTGDFLGDGKSGFLIENTGGWVVVGEVSGGRTTYSQVAALGSEWRFVGAGDFFGAGQGIASSTPGGAPSGGSQDQFLIENAAGQLDLGTVLNGRAVYTQIDKVASGWTVLGAGAFLGDGSAQFLAQTGSGRLEVGDVQNGKAVYTQVGSLGAEWKYVGSGDVLGDGKAQFLIENAAGVLVAGDLGSDGQAHYTTLAGLGPEWTVGGVGDYLGEGHDQFVLKNANGAVVIGDWSAGQVHYAQVGMLGSEWSFHG